MADDAPKTTGEHLATNGDVRRWGIWHLVAGVVSALGGTGGVIVFLLGYAHDVEAKSVTAAVAVATVQAQRIDLVKGDVDAQRAAQAQRDAGFAAKMQQLEDKLDASVRRSEQRGDAQEAALREILREVKRK